MNLLFFDTETTGFPDYHRPSDGEYQPHIVQLTALLTDYQGEKLSSMDFLIHPEGWTIDETSDAFKSNGITNERAMAGGVPEFEAVEMFMRLWECCDLRIAHNDAFDARIIRIGLKRMAGLADQMTPGAKARMQMWKDASKFCTFHKSTKHCKLPPTPKMMAAGRKKSFKPPTLGEAYKHFTGKELVGAHNAMVDLLACKTVYFGILEAEGASVQPAQELGLDGPEPLPASEPAPPAGPTVQRAPKAVKPAPAPEPDPNDEMPII